MTSAVRVAIQGFSSFERSTFEAFFRLSSRRVNAYESCQELRHCKYAIVDSDNASAVAQVAAAGKLGVSLLIGATPHPEAALRLPRPINLMALIKVLDQMAQAPAPAPAPAPEPHAVAAPVPPLPVPAPVPRAHADEILQTLVELKNAPVVRQQKPAPAPAPAPAAQVMAQTIAMAMAPAFAPAQQTAPVPGPLPEQKAPDPEPSSSAMEHILVVDDSDIALRFMASRLERFGFVVHLSRSGEDALERTELRHFSFVFMDVTMPGLDGFKTCKAIKRRTYGAGAEPPCVVMLTSRDTPIDKLRGTMAGCDGYLTKPLDELELLKLIGDREVERHEFAETARAEREH